MLERQTEELLAELADHVHNRFFGKYRGIVEDVDDPEGLGRVVAGVPAIYEDRNSPWALPAAPLAGPGHGLVVLPEVGDGVWIEFEAGDPSRPIWCGCWWGENDLPEPGGANVRRLVTSQGHALILDDEQNQVELRHAGGAEIVMSDESITLRIGSTELVLSANGLNVNNGAFEVR